MSAFDEFVNDEDKHEETTQEEAETREPQAEEMADTQEPEESGAEQEKEARRGRGRAGVREYRR